MTDARNSGRRQTHSDSAGLFRFAELAPGDYTLSATAPQFSAVTVGELHLSVDAKLRVDLSLPLKSAEQSVEVQAKVAAIQAESSELGAVIGRGRMEGLPLNQRDFLQLAFLVPGILPPVQDSELSTRGSFSMHSNGAREEFNNFLLDGVDNNDPDVNRYVLQPPVDSIQEFKIAASAYDAVYGRSAGGQVNVVTRSGGNQVHGFAYDYLRNRVLDARNFFDGPRKAAYIRNQFGTGVGGPLVKNRTFYFFNYDGLREHQGLTRLGSVPTAAMRAGDLSELGAPAMDPFTQTPFAGNRIPAERIDPLSAKVLALYPLPNLPGTAANYLGQPVQPNSQDQWNMRVDHRLTDRDQLTLRYTYGVKNLTEPYAETSTGIPGYGDILRDAGHNAMAQYQRLIGPRAVNNLLMGFNRALRSLLQANVATNVASQWGVNWLPSKPIDQGYPSFTVAGFSVVGDTATLPIDRAANTYQVADTLSYVAGAHLLKTGAEVRRIQHNGIADLLARGSLSFSGMLSGSGVGDLLLGYPTFGLQSQPNNTQTLRYTASAGFFQDDWKVTPRLTVNLGLRYEYDTPPVDPTNRMSILNLSTRQLSVVGSDGLSRSGTRPDRNNLAPRLGFAWSATDKTVLRGGYGVFYDSGMLVANTALYFNPPYFTIRVFFPSETSLLTLSDPFPTHGGYVPPASLSTVSPDMVSAYIQQWNLNVQHDFGRSGVVSAAYSGSKGTHLLRSLDLNQPPPGPGDVADRVPYAGFSNIFFEESGGDSSYHSLQLAYNRQMARGLSVLAAYTYSKSIDDTSAFLATKSDVNFPQNSHDYRAERAASSFDMRQRLSLTGVWALPGRMLRGFDVSAILAANTGQPFTPILQFDNSNTGNTGGTAGSDRPNVVGNPNNGPRTPAEWFNTAAFSIPAPYTFGNAGRNILRAPGYLSLDASLARRFRLAESVELRLEAQTFNLTNRANFNLPEAFADDPASFGRILSAKAPRQIQFALRLSF